MSRGKDEEGEGEGGKRDFMTGEVGELHPSPTVSWEVEVLSRREVSSSGSLGTKVLGTSQRPTGDL